MRYLLEKGIGDLEEEAQLFGVFYDLERQRITAEQQLQLLTAELDLQRLTNDLALQRLAAAGL